MIDSGILAYHYLRLLRDEYRCLVQHYNNYTVGKLDEGNKTLPENVADIIGIKLHMAV